MKRIRILVTVTKEFTYDYDNLYMQEGDAIDIAYDECIEKGEIKEANLEDYIIKDFKEEPEQEFS